MGITKRRLMQCLTAAAGIGAVVTTGCQTRIGGVPYPTPHYLQHVPQYFPPDPPFPLQRERDSMLDPTGEIRQGLPAAVAPPIGAAPVIVDVPVPIER